MWEVNISEREQGDSWADITASWVVDGKPLFSHSKHIDLKSAKQKNGFKTEANLLKTKHLARIAKQDNFNTTLKTFMNS